MPQTFEVISGEQAEVNKKLADLAKQKPASKPILMDAVHEGGLGTKIYILIQHG